MSQNIDVHSTDDAGTNIANGRPDGNGNHGNGSTYRIFRNAAVTNSGNQIYYGKDSEGNVEPIVGSGGSSFNVVSVVGPVTYNVTGSENVILADNRLGAININLLAASNPLSQNHTLTIKDVYDGKDANGVPYSITILRNGTDTIDGYTSITTLTRVGPMAAVELVSNKIDAYNILYQKKGTQIYDGSVNYNYLANDTLLGGKIVPGDHEIIFFQGADITMRLSSNPSFNDGWMVTIVAGTKLDGGGAQVGCTVTINTVYNMVGPAATTVLTQGKTATFVFIANTIQEDSLGGGCWYQVASSANVWIDLS